MDVIGTLLEITVYNPVSLSQKTLRYTNRNDPRATTYGGNAWKPVLITSPTISTSVFNGSFTGAGEQSFGSFSIALTSLEEDATAGYTWHGAIVKIYAINLQTGVATQLATAYGNGAQRTGVNNLTVELTSRDDALDVNLLYLSYAGTGDIEGTTEMTGVTKPMVFGDAKFCDPILIDPVRQIYQVHGYGPVESIYAVFEGGQVVGTSGNPAASYSTAGGHTYATFRDAAVAQGQWIRFNDYGLIKLGSQPSFPITVHAKGDSNAVNGGTMLSKIGGLVKRIVTMAATGVTVKAASTTALDTAEVAGHDLYFKDAVTVKDAIETLLLGIGGFWTWDETGQLIVGRVRFGASTFTLSGSNDRLPDVSSINQLPTSAPVWSFRLGAEQCHFVHDAASMPGIISQLQTDVSTAQSTANSKNKIFPESSTPPTGAVDGDLWPDTSVTPTTFRRYKLSTTSWIAISASGLVIPLYPLGTFTSVTGTTVSKSGGTHGAYQGGAVGSPVTGSGFIAAKILNIGGSWNINVGLDDDGTTYNGPTSVKYFAQYTSTGIGTGTVALYADGSLIASTGVTSPTDNSVLTLAYDGYRVSALVDGTVYAAVTNVTPNQKLWPKVISFYNDGGQGGVANVRYGPWNENVWSSISGTPGAPADNASADVTLTSNNANAVVTGNKFTKSNASYNNVVYSTESSALYGTISFLATASALGVIGVSTSQTAASPTYNDIAGILFDNTGGSQFYLTGFGITGLQGPYNYVATDRFDIVFDKLYLRVMKNGAQQGNPIYLATNQQMYLKASFSSSGTVISQIQFHRLVISWEALQGGAIPGDYATAGPVVFPDTHLFANWVFSGAGVQKVTGAAGDVSAVYLRGNGAGGTAQSIQMDLPPNKSTIWLLYYNRNSSGTTAAGYTNGGLDFGNADGTYNSSFVVPVNYPSSTSWKPVLVPIPIPAGAAKVNMNMSANANAGYTVDIALPNLWLTEPAADVTINAQVTIECTTDLSINADYLGAIAGVLSDVLWSPKVSRNGSTIKVDNTTTYALSGATGGTFAVDNTNGSSTKGNVSISAMSANTATVDLTIMVSGVVQPKITLKLTKNLAAPPSSGGGGTTVSWSGGEFVGINTTSYVAVVSTVKTLTLASGQSFYGTGYLDYYVSGLNGAARTMTLKWQYATVGSGSWNDFGSGITGSTGFAAVSTGPPDYGVEPASPGSINITQTKSGLSAGDYDLRLVGVCNTTGLVVTITDGVAAVGAKV